MESLLIAILILMILGAIYALHAKDLLSAIVSYGIVGFGLVICFLLLKAPDLAIVQIVVEIITLIIMIAVIMNTSREESSGDSPPKSVILYYIAGLVFIVVFIHFFTAAVKGLPIFGSDTTRMAAEYINNGMETTGSANLVAEVVLDYRAYDPLGEITILFTAVIGVLTVLRLKGRIKE
jgi:multisubunit Na+/H+ antiporter MnhB subunit